MSGLIINNSQIPQLIENRILNTISFDTDNSQKLRMDFGHNIVGDFIIGEKLGEGTFSKVCVGTHRITQEKVAIKIMSKEQIKEINDKLRIEKEINVQKKLYHSSIIKQYCIIETRSLIYIVSEYCSGGELFDYIVSKRRLNECEACRVFQQLIAGLEYLHKQRIVHRDLKPENLLFTSKYELKIADFGLSNEYTGKLSTPCGSPCYAAPEMVTGKKYHADLVDIWSAGVVLFTMVCGFLPFEDENQTGLFKKISKGLFSIPTFISAPCKDLIKSILITDPSKRFTFEMIKQHPWFNSSNNIMGNNIFFLSPGLFINEDIIPVDPDIVKELVYGYKYDLKEIIQDVIMNKHNAITTSYYLILKKKIKKAEKSISDYSSYSELFIEYIKKSISKLTYFCNDFPLIIDYHYNRLKGFFQIQNPKDTIDVDELQTVETTVLTENTLNEQVNTANSLYSSRYSNNDNTSITKKKVTIATHINKFINKKNNNHLMINNEQTGNNLNSSIKNGIVEPEFESSLFYTRETNTKGREINKVFNEQNVKKITDRIASIISVNSTIQHDINTTKNDFFAPSPSPKIIHTERIDYQMNSKQKECIKTVLNLPMISRRKKYINTSMISDSRSNSPTPIDNYFNFKLDLTKASKHKLNKQNLGLLYNNNKLANYSQDRTKINYIEIAFPKNNGHSFIEFHKIKNRYTHNNNNHLIHHQHHPGLTNRFEPQTKRTISASSHRKQNLSPMITGRTETSKLGKDIPRITNLNKFVNELSKKKINNKLVNKLIPKKNKSFEDQKPKSNRLSLHQTHYTKPVHKTFNIQPKHTKSIIKSHNQSIFNAFCRKSPNEIKEIVISVIGRDVILNHDTKVSSILINKTK